LERKHLVALKYSVRNYQLALQLIICNTQNKTLRKEKFPGPTRRTCLLGPAGFLRPANLLFCCRKPFGKRRHRPAHVLTVSAVPSHSTCNRILYLPVSPTAVSMAFAAFFNSL
jgi:hypothetical protein